MCLKANHAFTAHLRVYQQFVRGYHFVRQLARSPRTSSADEQKVDTHVFCCVINNGKNRNKPKFGFHRGKDNMEEKHITTKELGLSESSFSRKVRGHSIFLRGYNHNLQPETKIFRYIRLSTLLDLLFYGELHVSNRRDFTDLREKKLLNKITGNISVFSYVPNYRDRQKMKEMEKKALSVCVSCWTLDNRGNDKADESYLMWKAYSNNDITCRIGTTIGRLINSIKETPSDIVISDVDYQGQKEMNEYENLIFRKSLFYEDEQEVRMAVLSDNREGIDLKINKSTLLNEIKLSPFIPPTLGFFILGELQNWCKSNKCNDVNIEYSKLMEYVETNKNYKRNKDSRL